LIQGAIMAALAKRPRRNAVYNVGWSTILIAERPDSYVEVMLDKVLRMSELAVLARIRGKLQWIPKSVIDCPLDLRVGRKKQLTMVAEWFVREEGIGEGIG
jgi:hypothetical protein